MSLTWFVLDKVVIDVTPSDVGVKVVLGADVSLTWSFVDKDVCGTGVSGVDKVLLGEVLLGVIVPSAVSDVDNLELVSGLLTGVDKMIL